MAYARQNDGDSRPRLSREEIQARREVTVKDMVEAKATVKQLVRLLDGGELTIEELVDEDSKEVLGARFVRECSLIAALHMGGTAEQLAGVFFSGEEMVLAGLLAAARKVGFMPRDHFQWHTPRGRKADGSSLAENLRSGLSHAEWEKLSALVPKTERPSTAAKSWDELFEPTTGPRGSFLSAVIRMAEPPKDAKAEKSADAPKTAKPGGALAKLLGRKGGSTAPKAAEVPAPKAKVGLKAKLGGVKVASAKASKTTAGMSDAELGAMVASGKMSLEEALALRK